jgi:hypothetical protein
MKARASQTDIQKFIKNIKLFWQMIFLTGVLTYGVSFIYRFQVQPSLKNIDLINFLNWGSFFIAIVLAFYILHIKRTYFRLRYFQQFLEELHKQDPELDKTRVLRRFIHHISTKLKRVWILGLVIILIGVIYFWLTFDSWNMHVYFVVGLYSLVINYPRTDLFSDVPYILNEIFPDEPKENFSDAAPE